MSEGDTTYTCGMLLEFSDLQAALKNMSDEERRWSATRDGPHIEQGQSIGQVLIRYQEAGEQAAIIFAFPVFSDRILHWQLLELVCLHGSLATWISGATSELDGVSTNDELQDFYRAVVPLLQLGPKVSLGRRAEQNSQSGVAQ